MAYPAGAYPAGGYAVPPQKSGMSGCAKAAIVIVVLGLLLGGGCVVAALVFGDEVVDNIEDSRDAARRDIDIDSCELDDSGFMVAELSITNNSSERSNYVIEIGFRADDGSQSLETVSVFANGVESQDTVQQSARSITSATEPLECSVVEALRFSDESGAGD